MPSWGKAAANTALPQPPKTNQNVPINSAQYFFIKISHKVIRQRMMAA
jgi:hypothetical protein